VEDEPTFDAQVVQDAADVLLAENPDALVIAVDAAGLCVPMPASVVLHGQRILEGRSLHDHVVPADMSRLAHAWYDMLPVGRSETSVRLANSPDQWLVLHFVDVRAAHGVLLGIVLPETVEGEHVELNETQTSRPRYATLRQNNVGKLLGCDEAFTLMFGWTPEDLAGMTSSLDIVHPDDHARAIEGWMSMLATRRPHQYRCRRRTKAGEWIWLDTTLHNHLAQADRDYVLAEMIDISVEMAAQEALAAREQLLDRLAQALPVGLFQVDADRSVVYTNERLYEIFGTVETCDLDELLVTVTTEHRPNLDAALTAVLRDDREADVEVELRFAGTGERRTCHVSARPLNDKDGAVIGAIVCVADITESTRMHLELEDKATFDGLTRCYNRGSTMSALDDILSGAGSGTTGVIFVDLDNFKPVNDQLGHAAGDELLVSVAGRLVGAMRADDVVGRIGGDEFLIVCRNIEGPDDALVLARRITNALSREIVLDAGTIDLTASIGVACSEPEMTADALVAHADEAMYDSKRQGGGSPVLFARSAAPTPKSEDKGSSRRRTTRKVASAVGSASTRNGAAARRT
jgi:diguanylate cyclase (GGDEF)-like protein/PAS domain S-box-containing protein